MASLDFTFWKFLEHSAIETLLIVENTVLLLLFALFYKPRFINNKSPLVPTGSNNHLHKAQLSGATLVPSLSSLLAVVASSKSCQQVLEHANEVNISWQILGTSSLLSSSSALLERTASNPLIWRDPHWPSDSKLVVDCNGFNAGGNQELWPMNMTFGHQYSTEKHMHWHSVEKSGFFCQSDFTWNQYWSM